MLVKFFFLLRGAGVPASIPEFLTLLEALAAGLADASAERFYHLARTCLVKDERHYDRFDRAFAAHFKGVEDAFSLPPADLPADWLAKLAEKHLSAEEKARIAALGGWEKLMQTLRERLAEQKGRHQGGDKWVGTAGTSPYGAYGYNPEGVRIGQDQSRHRRAVKVWDRREFANLDDDVELGTRNMKLALRKLRRFARRGAAEELALADTIDATARAGGWLEVKMVPERRNLVK
ncbi:MAG: VWA domain-containing protein, partial [Gammaproteobacteria bacterium]|nr:VWA domain-containing protein [Gammaproteobacteria bacterium]